MSSQRTLSDLIQDCIDRKAGCKEFALHYVHTDRTWRAGIGNSSSHVLLGESKPEVKSDWCNSPEAAVAQLLRVLGG